jgi:hypothetical protein
LSFGGFSKDVWVENRRYVVCLNEAQRRKDAADREAIGQGLRRRRFD